MAAMTHPAHYGKALLAGAIAGVSALATGATDGSLELAEWLAAAAGALAAVGAVYGLPNRPIPAGTGAHRAEG